MAPYNITYVSKIAVSSFWYFYIAFDLHDEELLFHYSVTAYGLTVRNPAFAILDCVWLAPCKILHLLFLHYMWLERCRRIFHLIHRARTFKEERGGNKNHREAAHFKVHFIIR